MSAKLIPGNSREAIYEVKKIANEYEKLVMITVFFDNANFLLTKYYPLSNGVYLILEFENEKELHIEGANCGYGGEGPHATIDILSLFNVDKEEVKKYIFYCDSVQLSVDDGEILPIRLGESILFFPEVRYWRNNKSFQNKINRDKNLQIDLVKNKVVFYNPQRHCWRGFLNLISYMDCTEFEYYVGENSPLEGYLRLKTELRVGIYKPDIKGTTHVNLVLYGKKFKVACMIDREQEIQVIDSIHLALTGKGLFASEGYKLLIGRRINVMYLLKMLVKWGNKEQEIHEIIKVNKND